MSCEEEGAGCPSKQVREMPGKCLLPREGPERAGKTRSRGLDLTLSSIQQGPGSPHGGQRSTVTRLGSPCPCADAQPHADEGGPGGADAGARGGDMSEEGVSREERRGGSGPGGLPRGRPWLSPHQPHVGPNQPLPAAPTHCGIFGPQEGLHGVAEGGFEAWEGSCQRGSP